MSATVHILPIVSRIRPDDTAWREQFDREIDAVHEAMREPPPRTRPMLVVRNEPQGEFDIMIDAFNRLERLFACQRPEENR